ncbi:MAG: hypothetical protein L0Y71_06785 [Gemmataceae bacterium]|nr:hypothetical protein [Gemmataceae bacterium]
MGVLTLLRYLVGDATAVLSLAVHPRAWLVGLLFVVSAGFAREYDGEDLLRDPWYLLLPVVASLVSSFLLYCLLYGFFARRRPESPSLSPSFWSAYRAFVGLFWLTAPLAWLYAIPYERFLSPLAATYANLATLALVSAWRVALMVRVANVLFGLHPAIAFVRVVAYADAVALAAMFFVPFPIIEIMGGVRLPAEENAVRSATQLVAFWGGCSFPVWLILTITTFAMTPRPTWQAASLRPAASSPVSGALRWLVIGSLVIWAAALPLTQPEQQLRRRVEMALREGRVADGLKVMSAHARADFPPHWSPPPRYLHGEPMSLLFDIWHVLLRDDAAPWVRQHYLEQLKQYAKTRYYHYDVEKLGHLINVLPEGPALFEEIVRDNRNEWVLERLESHLRPELRRQK